MQERRVEEGGGRERGGGAESSRRYRVPCLCVRLLTLGDKGRGAPEAFQILLLSRSWGLLNPSLPLFLRLTPTYLPTPSATVDVGLTSWDFPAIAKNEVRRLKRDGCVDHHVRPKGAFQSWLRGHFFIRTLERGAAYSVCASMFTPLSSCPERLICTSCGKAITRSVQVTVPGC